MLLDLNLLRVSGIECIRPTMQMRKLEARRISNLVEVTQEVMELDMNLSLRSWWS